jgi:hypothetical protein
MYNRTRCRLFKEKENLTGLESLQRILKLAGIQAAFQSIKIATVRQRPDIGYREQ